MDMKRHLRALVIGIFLLGLLLVGMLGTETRLLFYWPACALLGVAALLTVVRGGWALRSPPSDGTMATALLFGGYVIVRCVTSPVAAWAREDLFIMLGCAVTYVLGATALSQRRTMALVLGVIILLTVGNLVVGFVHFSGWWSFRLVPGFIRPDADAHRIGGFFNNPNHLAAFLTMCAVFLMGVALFGRSGAVGRLLLIFLALAAAIGVALTVSRAAMVGMTAGGLVLLVISLWVLWHTQRHRIGAILGGVLVIAGLGLVVIYGVFSPQLQRRAGTVGVGDGDPRGLVWRSALAQWHEHPVIGAGARMFYDGCVRLRPEDAPSWMKDARFAHNDWLQLLCDYGWIGAALFLLMLGAHLLQLSRYLHWFVHERFPRTASPLSSHLGYLAGSAAALAAALAHAVFEFHFHVAAVAIFAALFFGVLANPGIIDPLNPPRRRPGVRLLVKFALVPVGAVLLWGTWVHGRSDYCTARAGLAPSDPEERFVHRLEWLTKATDIDPSNMHAFYLRGRERMVTAATSPEALSAMLLKRAATDLEAAYRMNTHDYHINMALGEVYDAVGRPDDAEPVIREAIRLAPFYLAPRLSLAVHFHRLARFAEAEEAYLDAREARAEITEDWRAYYMQMIRDSAG